MIHLEAFNYKSSMLTERNLCNKGIGGKFGAKSEKLDYL
jgi:hypothetical protein